MFIGKIVTYTGLNPVNGRKDYPALVIDDFNAENYGPVNLIVFDTAGPRNEYSVVHKGDDIEGNGPHWELT